MLKYPVDFNDYDVRMVGKWKCPKEGGPQLLTMPNIPSPLHGKGCQPRTILGQTEWDKIRKRTYYNAMYKCEICGCEPPKGKLHAHELFSYNYKTRVATFDRPVAVCKSCHDFIHSGRMLTCYRKGEPYYPKSYLLKTIEHGFKIISDASIDSKKKLRVYAGLLEYVRDPNLHNEMIELINRYNIKFYIPMAGSEQAWGEWKVIINNETYNSPYKNEEEWQEAMQEQSSHAAETFSPKKTETDLIIEQILAEEKNSEK